MKDFFDRLRFFSIASSLIECIYLASLTYFEPAKPPSLAFTLLALIVGALVGTLTTYIPWIWEKKDN